MVSKSDMNKRPSSLDAHIGFWMRFVSNNVSDRFQKLLKEKEVSVTEWVALRTLYDGEVTTHTAMIQALGMTKSAASKVLTRLEEKGLAERRYPDSSAKSQIVALTKKGQSLVPELAALADANDDFYFGHIDQQTKAHLLKVLRELVDTHQLTDVPVN